MRCWQCDRMLVVQGVERPPVTEPPTIHITREVVCIKCGSIYEVTTILVGHREFKEVTDGQDPIPT